MSNLHLINKKAMKELLNDSYVEAGKLFKDNLKINPSYLTYNNYSVFLAYCNSISLFKASTADIDVFKKYFYKSIELKPNSKSYYALAYIHFDTNVYEKAIDYYIKGIKIDDNLINQNIAKYNLAFIYAHKKVKDYNKAYEVIKLIDNSSLLKQKNFNSYFKLYSYILYRLNKIDELNTLFEKYHKLIYDNDDDDNFESLLIIAYFLHKTEYILNLDYKRLYNYEFIYYYIIFSAYYNFKKDTYKEVVAYFINNAETEKSNAYDKSKITIIEKSLKYVFDNKDIKFNYARFFISFIPSKLFLCLYIGCNCEYNL